MTAHDVLVLVVVMCEFALVALITMAVARRIESRAAQRTQLELKLLDRLSTTKELEDFLATDAGQHLLAGGSRRHEAMGRIVGTMQVGVALAALGLGVLLVALFLGDKAPLVAGTVVTALGAGLVGGLFFLRHPRHTGGLDTATLPAPAAPPPPAAPLPAAARPPAAPPPLAAAPPAGPSPPVPSSSVPQPA